MDSDFKVLSLREEEKLGKEEKQKYYLDLRKYVCDRPLQTTTPGALTVAPKLKKVTEKIAIAVTKAFTNKNVEWIVDGQENIPVGPVVFAYNHQGILDNFVFLPAVDKHCLILHGADVNRLLLLCQVNTGLVLVRKGDIQNNHDAKLDMIRLLMEGHSITYFPEGTWNLSPNKLHLPMAYGFLDVARKAGVPVVPVAHDYTYDTSQSKETITRIHTRFGAPIFVGIDDDLKEKLEEYKESISTLVYTLMEEKEITKRETISNQDYIHMMKGSIKNLKLGKIDLDTERKYIFGAKDEFYQFFPINDISFDEEGNLLDTDEVQKIKRINREHLISFR